jgi:hypothetical protein
MEPIDSAFKAFNKLMSEVEAYDATIRSEQDTRLKVINRMLTEVLGWQYEEITTDEQAGDTGFIDYRLSVGKFSRLVIEAKKDGLPLGIENRDAGRAKGDEWWTILDSNQ